MAANKIVRSYSLSKEAISKINKIKEEKNYRSVSEALEAIILGKETDVDTFRKIVLDVLKEHQLAATLQSSEDISDDKKLKDEVEQNLLASMNDIFKDIK
jgi:hypothetical protein